MKIFAVDTAARACSVALAEDATVLYEEVLDLGLTHSETMQEACNRALEALDWNYHDIDLFAVTRGPGSFTGLRIGLTAAKTFAYATDKPILGLSSLAVLAEPFNLAENSAVLSLLDARHRRVYSGLYQNGKTLLPEKLGDIDDYLSEVIAQCGQFDIDRLILTGDCADRYFEDKAVHKQINDANMKIVLSVQSDIRAASLARLAFKTQAESPEFVQSAADLLPLYLTATEAERGANFYV